MGIIKYILPIGTFLIGIKIALNDDEYLTSKLTQYAVLLISIAVLMTAWQINSGEMTILDKNMQTIVRDAYSLGMQDKGGGALGAILATPLANLLSPVGAIILCVGIVIMLAVFTFGINISQIPLLAKGGVISQPTQAIIGEAGREAVVPLENNMEWLDILADRLSKKIGNSGGSYIIQMDGRTIQRGIARKQQELAFSTNGR